MRVIAGTSKGTLLKSPDKNHEFSRPTMDRVRSALFSILGERIIEAHILDLFAGSGSVGIEALSRGASSAHFVDHHHHAIASIKSNLTKAKVCGQLLQADIFEALSQLQHSQETESLPLFDIIFADPPYAKDPEHSFLKKLLVTPKLFQLLAPEGLLILEAPKKESLLIPESWQTVVERCYGHSRILILREKMTE